MGSSLVKYATYDAEDAAKDKEDLDKSGGSSTFIKLKVGTTKVRIVPPLMPKDPKAKKPSWRRVTYVHYVAVPGQEDNVSIVCPRLEAKEKCILCDKEKELWDKVNELEAEGSNARAEATKKIAKSLKAKRRCYANAIDRAQPENGCMVLAFGPMIEDQLIKIRQDEEDGGDFTHPVKGFDVKITREGQGKNDTEYTVVKSKVGPIVEDVDEMNEILGKQHNLERYCRVYSTEDIQKILRGEKPGEDDDEDRSKPKNKVKSKTKPADDDDDTIEGEIVDDEFEIED